MRTHKLLIAAVAVVWGGVITGAVLAQGANPPPQAPAGQAPPAPGGRGPGAGQPPAGRQGGGPGGPAGGRRGGYPQYTRELAPQDVIVRGKSLYDATCASCHAADLRGSANAPNLLRAGMALNDQKGELIAAAVAKHTSRLTLVEPDTVAIAEYIHSVHATMGGQGSPPGRNPTNVTLNVLVGDAKAGETAFGTLCASCHSVTGNLKGIGGKFSEPRALQNAWFIGSSATFGGGGGGRGGAAGAGNPATVTMADGSKLEGTLLRQDDFLVVLTLADGTRRSIARANGVPRVDVKDPNEPHKNMAMKLIFDDPDNKKMHDITAYLWTIK